VGLRLLILSWMTPKFIIRRELENISDKTTTALNILTSKYATKTFDTENQQKRPKSIQEQRVAMAQTQAKLVETLATAVGHDEAVKLGRENLFSVGKDLGKQARSSLGVGDNPKDLARAAKILYRILGIEFHLEWHDQSSATLIIDQCALAKQYSKTTCEILSATDEGVINGLQPRLTMKFKEYITSGCKNCRASINLNQKEAQN
jgi:hypothetical protein